MNLIEKRKVSGFFDIRKPIQVALILSDVEKRQLIVKKSIIIDRIPGRFEISIPCCYDGKLISKIISVRQLPRAAGYVERYL